VYQDVSNPFDESFPKEMKKMLVAKKYVRLAEPTMDVHLRRDSIKKLMNCFTEIANLTSARLNMEEKVKYRERSIEKLALYTTKEIDEREASDPEFVKEFSYARAVYLSSVLSKTSK
jgi:hypothetical protein